MKISIVAGTLMLALAAPLVGAESSSSQTSTYSTTTKSVPTAPSSRSLSDLGRIYCGGGIAVHIDAHRR